MATKVKGYRFNETTLNQLSELCEIYGLEETTLLKRLVEQEYLRVTEVGKDKVKKANDTMKALIDNLAEYLSEGDQ